MCAVWGRSIAALVPSSGVAVGFDAADCSLGILAAGAAAQLCSPATEGTGPDPCRCSCPRSSSIGAAAACADVVPWRGRGELRAGLSREAPRLSGDEKASSAAPPEPVPLARPSEADGGKRPRLRAPRSCSAAYSRRCRLLTKGALSHDSTYGIVPAGRCRPAVPRTRASRTARWSRAARHCCCDACSESICSCAREAIHCTIDMACWTALDCAGTLLSAVGTA